MIPSVVLCNVYPALMYREDQITSKIKSTCSNMPTLLVTICYCLISPVLVLFEEVFLTTSNFKTTRSVNGIKKQWEDMDEAPFFIGGTKLQ